MTQWHETLVQRMIWLGKSLQQKSDDPDLFDGRCRVLRLLKSQWAEAGLPQQWSEQMFSHYLEYGHARGWSTASLYHSPANDFPFIDTSTSTRCYR